MASRLPVLARVVVALAAGALLALGFQPWGLWPLPIVGVALLTWLVEGRTAGGAFGYGFAAGVVLNYLVIFWVSAQAGPAVHALIALMACWIGLAASLTALLLRLKRRTLWVPTAWVLIEFGAQTVPFQGFPWIRLGHTVIDQPMSGWLPVVATPGTTWLVAFAGCLVLRLVARPRRLVPVLVLGAIFAVGALVNLRPLPALDRDVTVGMVQGNVALDLDYGYIAATGAAPNHLSETIFLLADARAKGTALDFVLWAENSTDQDPYRDDATRRQVAASAALAQVPVFYGAITVEPAAETRQTVSLWWDPQLGETARHTKRNLAPFGEWVPYRDIIEPLFPEVRRAGWQSVPGTGTGVLDVATPRSGALRVGTVICYELAYDQTVYELAWHQPDVLVAQSTTHNFTGTAEPRQQMVINRVRAAELGREFVATTLNGYSGLIDARGGLHEPTIEGTAAHRIFTVPVRSGLTPGVILAIPVQAFCCLAAVGGALLGAYRQSSNLS